MMFVDVLECAWVVCSSKTSNLLALVTVLCNVPPFHYLRAEDEKAGWLWTELAFAYLSNIHHDFCLLFLHHEIGNWHVTIMDVASGRSRQARMGVNLLPSA
jgi:hypothetical protein